VQQFKGITDTRIHLLDLETGALRELVGLPGKASGNVAVDFDAEGRGVFFVSNQRGGAAEIGWAPLAGDEPVRWVTEGLQWGITEFELSPDGRRGAFVSNENGVSRLYLFDPARLRWRSVPSIPTGIIYGLRFDEDGRRLGMTVSTPSAGREAMVLSLGRSPTAGRRLTAWTDGQPGDAERSSLVSPTLFSFTSTLPGQDRALQIPGFAYVPPGRGPFPVVIYFHGGPESQFRPSFHEQVQLWASRMGVAVLAPNYRGSLGYGAGYLALDDGRRREDVLLDIEALLDLIEKAPSLDASRVAVYGASYGGYLALASAVHFSDRLVAAINRAGISHFVSYLENTEDYRRDLRRSEYGDERDPEMRAFLDTISPLNHADRISVPLLIVQGQNDPVVPVSESDQMVRALRKQGQEVWYLKALNEGHDYARQENLAIYRQVAYLFLERHLWPDRKRE
jgi:dipeptidyl aminopeptidase/acylaminoacyl peptidase